MIIIGIDPGLVNTGYGIISIKNEIPSLIDFGIIAPNTKDSVPERIFTIFTDVCHLIEKYNPTIFSIEDVFYSRNFKSAMLLGQARGAAILAASKYKISIFEYSAKKVKQSITGNGNADKTQVQYMVTKILKIKNNSIPLDASDALAIGMCHINQLKVNEL
tara:strand:+ start:2516 stop:2998 length:483 start_codon:yes stop_codon:yes gene_type:complete